MLKGDREGNEAEKFWSGRVSMEGRVADSGECPFTDHILKAKAWLAY
jgi:hypothetical protein